jgi:signal transduction histidine kinase
MFFKTTQFSSDERRPVPGLWVRILITLGLIVAALSITETLWLFVDRPISSTLFLVAIAVTAWQCGFRYAVVSAVISGILIDFCFIQPQFQFHGDQDEISRLIVFVFEGTAISWLVRKLHLANEQIRAKNVELRALTDHQQRLREEEQKRIAREVHDELGQSLTGLKMGLHFLKGKVPVSDRSTLEKGLDDLMDMTDSTLTTVRRISRDLRPSLLDDFGLVSAVEWQVQEFERGTSIPCSFSSNCDSIDLGSESNTQMYRVVQEALTNIARHASANSVAVNFAAGDSEVQITIHDDGVGIGTLSQKAPSLGLIGMQERSRMIGGELEIIGSPMSGTTVTLTVPYTNGHNGNGALHEVSL